MNTNELAVKCIEIIREQRNVLKQIYEQVLNDKDTKTAEYRLSRWRERTIRLLEDNISTSESANFFKIGTPAIVAPMVYIKNAVDVYDSYLLALEESLENHPEYILNKKNEIPFSENIGNENLGLSQSKNSTDLVIHLCNRFHHFARQLRIRERGREPLLIKDEYDLQYLFCALLNLHFEDVRPEEWAPSYAGSSSRMDFLVKSMDIVIEVKKTRNGLLDKQVGEQLIIDIDKYRTHPNCQTLICFVYDPDELLNNPRGLENDLSGHREEIDVIVIVKP